MDSPFVRLIAESLLEQRFTLVDVGCSGGIEPIWRAFGERLAALAIDACISECDRLRAEETNPAIRYLAGFAGIPPDHPFAIHAAGKPISEDPMFDRYSAAWVRDMRLADLAGRPDTEKLALNLWPQTQLADPSKPVFVPQVLEDMGWSDVDFLKIDIDGADFHVLNSFDGLFEELGLLGVRLEVCAFGGTEDTANTFHNTDRFMRRQGYDLVRLDPRSYSMRALPSRFAITMPAQTVSGRLLQAEAYYVRDLVIPRWQRLAESMSTEKIMKLAAIYSAWDQPDAAAELLLAFRPRIEKLLDVDQALDMLAAQTQRADREDRETISYREHMELFAAGSPEFYPPISPPPPPPPPRPTLWQRVQAAWFSVSDWYYIQKLEQERQERQDRRR
jgi:hypothetical protein